MDKEAELSKIAKEIENCKICKQGKIGKAVAGEGNPDAKIVFVGEAPGRLEAETGRPFVGRSGKLLRSIIKNNGIDEKDIFIVNAVKYLPLKGTPSMQDISHGKIHLDKQLKIINPKLIVLLGRVAIQAILQEPISVKKDHGRVIEKNGVKYFITFHPSAGLRFPPLKELLIKDLGELKKVIK